MQLNDLLKNNFFAINRYFLQARTSKQRPAVKLTGREYRLPTNPMKYADMLIEQVTLLGSAPQMPEPSRTIEPTSLERLQYKLTMAGAVEIQIEAMMDLCEDDSVSRLRGMLTRQQNHIRSLREQIAEHEASQEKQRREDA